MVLTDSEDDANEAQSKLLSEEFLEFPPGFGGRVFQISNDEPAPQLETLEQQAAREGRNADRARRREEERLARAAAGNSGGGVDNNIDNRPSPVNPRNPRGAIGGGAPQGGQGAPRVPPRNLEAKFDMVGNRVVYKTPSANIAVALHNLRALPNTPEVQEAVDHL